jgi:parallel beta-helix repeat protein
VPIRYTRDYELYTPIVFSVVGFRHHGKTVYLASLLNEFERLSLHQKAFSYTPLDETGLNVVRQKQRSLERGQLPDATDKIFPKPVILQLEGMAELKACRLLTYDIGGEVFKRVSELRQYAGYVAQGRSSVWLVSIEDLESPIAAEAPQDLTDLVGRYVQAVLELGGQPKDQTIVIVLTKGDKLLKRNDIPDLLRRFLQGDRPWTEESQPSLSNELSDEIEKWLEGRAGYQNFVRRVRKEFELVKYCCVSALGSEPRGQELDISLTARGVLEPLRWILRFEQDRNNLIESLRRLELAFSSKKSLIETYEGKTTSARLERQIFKAKEALGASSITRGSESVRIVDTNLARSLNRVRLKQGRRYLFAFILVSLVAAIAGWAGWKFWLRRQRKEEWYVRENLEQMIAEGGVVELPPGDYSLQTLTLVHPVSLKGSGRERTRIIYKDGSLNLTMKADATFVATDITFEYGGTRPANVLTIQSGRFDLQRCRFQGGVADQQQFTAGNGIQLESKSTGTILECEFIQNGKHGVSANDMAQITMTGSSIRQNQGAGISYISSVPGTLQNNDCYANQSHGIEVGEQANPIVANNICRNNKGSGISYSGSATGTIRQNRCLSNHLNGITVDGLAQPSIEGNNCLGNERSGVAYSGNASGIARDNECVNNILYGISVSKKAQPELAGNKCRDNGQSGIVFVDGAGGSASKNETIKNRTNGISVEGTANPTLLGNICNENKKCGIRYAGRSTGAARNNQIAHNTTQGILVQDQSQPELDNNTCEQNGDSGIAYIGRSAGTAHDNECTRNGANGISVSEPADPNLGENHCADNSSEDVMDWRLEPEEETQPEDLGTDRPRRISPTPPR